jgi:hypothetical protein
MNTRKTFGSEHPPALTHLFEPPEDHIGCFGWLCGYSADAFCMNDAAERFTRRTKRRRAADGDVSLGLILDPGSPRLSTVDVPGVLHLPLPPRCPFSLMHAKVALLSFRHVKDGARWCLRLIVSTGNWTRETLEESLDLAWTVEVASDALNAEQAGMRLVDLKAGSTFLASLRAMIGPSPLDAASRVTSEAVKSVDAWCSAAAAKAPHNIRSRFIDSWTQALLPQIVTRITSGKRNYLAMGSGFYEGGDSGALPSVPATIVKALSSAGLQTPKVDIELFVNPDGCQAVAGALPAIKRAGWTVRRPGHNPSRSLHAKFLFGAGSDGRSRRCLRAWVYLGSGNLTRPGLLLAAPAGGNLEAGVVFAPDNLVWEEATEVGTVLVQKILPIAWDAATEILDGDVQAGSDMPDRPPAYLAPPVPYLHWTSTPDGTGRLVPPLDVAADFTVLDPSGAGCVRDGAGILWLGGCPPEVTVAWSEAEQRCAERVPVIDAHGRIAAAALAPVALEEVWALLADFPLPPADDADEPDEDDAEASGVRTGRASRAGNVVPPGRYAIRRVMELVEQIAARQTALQEADWTAWCVRLGQTLEQAGDDAEIAAFRTLGLNPLSPLRAAPFRPDFACDGTTSAGRLYEETLDRVAMAWQIDTLEPLEA